MSKYLTTDGLKKILYFRRLPWGLRPVAFATSATWLIRHCLAHSLVSRKLPVLVERYFVVRDERGLWRQPRDAGLDLDDWKERKQRRVHGVFTTTTCTSASAATTWTVLLLVNQSINQSKFLINSCQTATEHIHMNCTNKNNDKMQ